MKLRGIFFIFLFIAFSISFAQVANPVNDLEVCDNDSDGDDTNGFFQGFDFSFQTPAILGGQSPSDFTVSYHESLTDANNGTNALVSPYSNTIPNVQTIYARVTDNNNTNNFATTSFNIVVNALPVTLSVVELRQCDDDTDGFSVFNLTDANSDISSNSVNETFRYYETQVDAQNSTNEIINSQAYTNQTQTSDIVWARTIDSNTGCFRVSQINLIVSTTGIPSSFQRNFSECDDFLDINGNNNANNDDTDGVASFDFSSVTPEIQNLFPSSQQLAIAYYESESDALAEINAITDISNYRNINSPNSQTIYVRVNSLLDNDCVGFGPYITLTVDPVPISNPVSNLSACDNDNDGSDQNGLIQSFDLESQTSSILGAQDPNDFSVSYHISQADATSGTNAVSSPFSNSIAFSQQIYVRVQNLSTGCVNDDESFQVVVNPAPSFEVSSPQIVCRDGGALVLSVDNPAGAYDYSWVTPSGGILNDNQITITSGGQYTVTAMAIDGTGCTSSRSIMVSESEAASIVSNDLTVNGSTLLINTSNLGIGDYEYSITDASSNIVRPYQDAPQFDNLQPNMYLLFVRDKNGCGEVSIQFEVEDHTVSVAEVDKVQFTMHPNPVDAECILELSDTLNDEITIQLFNLQGKLIQQQIQTPVQNRMQMDVSQVSNGLYLVKVKSNGKASVQKLIVHHQ